jgi:hypothetical protein
MPFRIFGPFREHDVVTKREPPDVSELAPFVEWDRVVERVRKAKTQESAVLLLKRHMRSGLEWAQTMRRSKQHTEAIRQAEQRNTQARIDAMARAMAMANPHLGDDHDYIADATRLDNALQIRKQYEI